ncbi:DUF2218 domain-containing protein [Thalassococcus lentus]|uniref:DUF2218 domain-containing protein n=1 Tax=Thalassococcus lentus TaxID=1210524 RepID=A0ABT4XPY1_9RHOB|nr:DUF2218 domain-containing protein [Thalassococcus lentus]MDA7423991.1 DUF2218 domain-containing protein [Thalassococcus lentus]
MTSSTLHLTTPHGSKYLQQLGKHFGHKVPVTFTTTEAEVTLPFGACKMTATEADLSITVLGKSHDLERLERFVGDHLARFAFRENPTLTWQRAA